MTSMNSVVAVFLIIRTSGVSREQIGVAKVLFISWKVAAMQRFIAQEPEGAETA